MKIAIYISGISGMMLVVLRLLGEVMDFSANNIILIAALILLFVVFLPLVIVDKYQQNKKIDAIIESYKGKKGDKVAEATDEFKGKGWSMNNSPYRKRKSGLNWGGGNISAATASRGNRKTFLK